MDSVTLKLPQFEGPLELLSALVQKEEIDICTLVLKDLIDQIISVTDFELGSESLIHAGSLLWIKSRALLPKNEGESDLENEADTPLSLLEKLVEYCRFKEAARNLSLREERAGESYFRPCVSVEGYKKPLGLEHVSLEELAKTFQMVLEKAKEHHGIIEEEEWRVSDKMVYIRKHIQTQEIPFDELFSTNASREELIVFFLAVLELMKLNEIRVVRKTAQMVIIPYAK